MTNSDTGSTRTDPNPTYPTWIIVPSGGARGYHLPELTDDGWKSYCYVGITKPKLKKRMVVEPIYTPCSRCFDDGWGEVRENASAHSTVNCPGCNYKMQKDGADDRGVVWKCIGCGYGIWEQ